MKKTTILKFLTIIFLVQSISATSIYPPIVEPLPKMNFMYGEEVMFEIAVQNFDNETQLEITSNTSNSLNEESVLDFLYSEGNKGIWRLSWNKSENSQFENLDIKAKNNKYSNTQKVTINFSQNETILSTPAIFSAEDYVNIAKNETTGRFAAIRNGDYARITALTKDENVEYQFRHLTNSEETLFEWQQENSIDFIPPTSAYYFFSVRTRKEGLTSEWSDNYFFVRSYPENQLLPPKVQILNPVQTSALNFEIEFFPNNENTETIIGYTAKIRFPGMGVNQEIEFDSINGEELNEEIYKISLNLTEDIFLNHLQNSLNNEYFTFINLIIRANTLDGTKQYTNAIILAENFPKISEIQVTDITHSSANIFVSSTNPEELYNITSYRFYTDEEFLGEMNYDSQPFLLEGLEQNFNYENKIYVRPVHNNLFESSKAYLPEFTTQINNEIVSWSISEKPVFHDEIYDFHKELSTLQTENLVYFTYRTKNYGNIMGRIEKATGNIEYWNGTLWSSEANVIPDSIAHSLAAYRKVNLIRDLTNPEGLIGTAIAGYRIHNSPLDTHGTAINFKFDGEEFLQWSGDSNYEKYFFKDVIPSWSGSGTGFELAINPETNTGIAVGTIGKYARINPPYLRQLTAVKFEPNENQVWKRWNAGEWVNGNNWPQSTPGAGQVAWILNPNPLDASTKEYDIPEIVHLEGTEEFLIIFEYKTPTKIIGSAVYSESPSPVWHHFTENGWETGINYNYKNIAISSQIKEKKLISITEGKASLIFSSGNKLYYSNFYHEPNSVLEGVWSPPEMILENSEEIKELKVTKDIQNNLWILFKGQSSNLKLIRQINNQWTEVENVFSSPKEIEILSFDIIDEAPLAFISLKENNSRKVFLLKENEIEQNSFENEFIQNQIPLERIKWNSSLISENAFGVMAPSIGVTGQFELSEDDYLFLPQSTLFSVSIMNVEEQFQTSQGNRWGHFADYFYFPGGAAVYENKSTVYITNRMVGVSGSSSIENEGYITAWNYEPEIRDIRTEDLFANVPSLNGNYSVETYSYGEQIFSRGLSFGTDLTVDKNRGLLIVSDSAKNKLLVYDIENLENLIGNETQNNFHRISFIEDKIPSPDKQRATAIINSMIEQEYLGNFTQGNYEKLYWIEIDEQRTLNFIREHPEWNLISSDYNKGLFLRLVSQKFKLYREVPVFLYELGGKGKDLGEFELPYGHDIGLDGNLYIADSENNRIQKFTFNEETTRFEAELEFGKKGRGYGEMINPLGVSVDKKYNLVFVTVPTNNKIMIFSNEGEFITEFSTWQNDETEKTFISNSGIAADGKGNFYVSNLMSIEKFSIVDAEPEIFYSSISENSSEITITAKDDWGIRKIKIIIGGEIEEIELNYLLEYEKTIYLENNFSEYGEITIIVEDSGNHSKIIHITNNYDGDISETDEDIEEENDNSNQGGTSSTQTQSSSQINNPSVEILTSNCKEDWKCTEWSQCSGEIKIRTCYDKNACRTYNLMPQTTMECFSFDKNNENSQKYIFLLLSIIITVSIFSIIITKKTIRNLFNL